MSKRLVTSLVLFSFCLCSNFLAQSVTNSQFQDLSTITGEKVELPYQTVYREGSEDVLFDNGPLVTLPAGGCAGGDASILDGTLGHGVLGWGHQQNLGNYMADDFTSSARWNIDSLKFFAYQTGATAVTITGVYVQVWNGSPMAGGFVVWGDLTTNRLQRAGLSDIYRAQSTTPTDCNRRIQEVVATVDTILPAGQYWVQWGMTGSLASGPWCPPVAISGQAITGDALQNIAGVWYEALNGASQNGAPFIVYGTSGAPCPVGIATNPYPPDGSTISVYPGNLTWLNGANTTQIEVFFGYAGNMVSFYNGIPIISYPIPSPLDYNTTYQWKVVCSNDTCSGAPVETWTFTTEQNPNYLFADEFNNFNQWTIVGPLGLTNWSTAASANAGGVAPELRMAWTPSFNGESRIRSRVINAPNSMYLIFTFKWFFDWFADPSGIIGLATTYDGGMTTVPLWSVVDPTDNIGPEQITVNFVTPSTGSSNLQFELYFIGNSFNNDNIYWDDMLISICLGCYPPSAPSNLLAQLIFNPNPHVQLNWQDNSCDEYGFIISRKFGYPNDPGDYIVIHTTQNNITQYIDATVLPESTYTYRVFAFNQYGQSGSNTASIEVPIPVELISFTSQVDDNVVTLLWQTATETNNSGFEIQRLQDSKIEDFQCWKQIGFAEGKGTTTEIQSYSFQDKPGPGKYKYRLKQKDFDGSCAYSQEIEAEVLAPKDFSLSQNYPNPFNPGTTINFSLAVDSKVSLKIFDVLGREVATLVNGQLAAGNHPVSFDASSLNSGVYFYRIDASGIDGQNFSSTRKMILTK